MNKVTIRDVAKEANVSIATVSRVINKSGYVSESTKEIVLEVIRKLNYKPNEVARSFSSDKGKIIGLILPDITNHFFANVARGVEDLAEVNGYQVMFSNTDNNLISELNALEMFLKQNVGGIIICGSVQSQNPNMNMLKESLSYYLNQTSIIVVDRKMDMKCHGIVAVDNKLGGYLATKHLIQLGHKRIALLNGPKYLKPSQDREAGYKQALEEGGLSGLENFVSYGDYTFESGIEQANAFLAQKEKASAIFATNDLIAIGAIQRLQKENIRIPEEMAVVGYDDSLLAALVSPPLTTIVQPAYTMGKTAMEMLVKQINDPNRKVEEKLFDPYLKVRSTSGVKRGLSR